MTRQLGTLAIALAAGMMATSADAFWGSHGGSYGGRSYGSYGGGSYGGGSYGGSYVSSGSHGSYGGGPIRRIASRIHARHAARGSYGSYGGASYGGSSYGGGSYGGGSYGGGSYGGHRYVASYASCGSHGSSYSSPVYETYDGGYIESTPPQQPTPADDSGANVGTDAGLLRVEVPADAKVFVNGKLTTSEGTERQFVSYGLERGMSYKYDVRVEFVADGQTVTESRQVTLTAGSEELLAFAAPSTPVETIATTLELTVPEGAKVRLAGVETKQTGTTRQFVTNRLSTGSTWDNYTIEVEATIDGKVVRDAKTISLAAGETRQLAFDFEKASPQLAMASGN